MWSPQGQHFAVFLQPVLLLLKFLLVAMLGTLFYVQRTTFHQVHDSLSWVYREDTDGVCTTATQHTGHLVFLEEDR